DLPIGPASRITRSDKEQLQGVFREEQGFQEEHVEPAPVLTEIPQLADRAGQGEQAPFSFLTGAAAVVDDHSPGHVLDPPASPTGPLAEVGVFHIKEVPFIEGTHLLQHAPAYHETAAGQPVHRNRLSAPM